MSSTPSLPSGVVRLRDQHEALTRRQILRVARRLFRERGYAGTSVRLLAEQAGVAVQTIYSAFGSKAGVLAGLPDLIDEEAEVHDIVAQRDQTDDPRELLALIARLDRQVWERCGDIIELLQKNTAGEPEIDEAYAESMRRHRFGIEWTVQRIQASGVLRSDLSLQRAADVTEVILSTESWNILVGQRGWSVDEYEVWVATTLEVLLLATD